eukprot:CAMPEP_0117655724 /NCGR_PEP_ID=MMETSP0804-20121206/4431_1 /TAXON_ID=1074897 /ORGANISM="Tetraselmis astigmatica, Strain CCMP880" /LENGTH=125 /DNA_ID=CAMNT_0005462093 /DNA_START=110 /DNA_END=487 /DNA_ORIENTATION=+
MVFTFSAKRARSENNFIPSATVAPTVTKGIACCTGPGSFAQVSTVACRASRLQLSWDLDGLGSFQDRRSELLAFAVYALPQLGGRLACARAPARARAGAGTRADIGAPARTTHAGGGVFRAAAGW